MLQFTLFLAVCIQSVVGGCNLGWLEYEDSCYSFNKERFSWYEAAATCMIYGAHLAQVESQKENAWLASQLKDANIVQAWLGGTARQHAGVWEWVPSFRIIGEVQEHTGFLAKTWKKVSKWLPGSKPPTTYLNWAPGEPNNKDNKGEDCMEIYSNLLWNDASCLYKKAFICEKETCSMYFCPPQRSLQSSSA